MKPLFIDYIDLIKLPIKEMDYKKIESKFKELSEICKNRKIKLLITDADTKELKEFKLEK